MDSLSEAREALNLIQRCLSGDRGAAREFQETYGELIYGYPIRVFRVPRDEAGDFYVFAFEQGRIFRRVRTFEGRAPFRAYLLGYVLDDLVLEWKRRAREIETVSMDSLGELADPAAEDQAERGLDGQVMRELIAELPPAKSVVMKLLYVEDYELTPEELRHVAKLAGVPFAEVVAGVEGLRARVREREATLKRTEDALDGVQAWIQLYDRRVRRIGEDLASLPPASSAATRLREERSELERKIERRRKQRVRLVGETQRRKVTAPYREIAALLGTSVGNVGSQIARLRRELLARLAERRARDDSRAAGNGKDQGGGHAVASGQRGG